MRRSKGCWLVLFLVVVLLTGCSNKLKCNIKTNNYVSKVVIGYEDDKPTTYNFSDKMMFSVQAPEAEIYYHSKYYEYGTLISEKYAKMRNAADYVSLKIKYDFTKNQSEQENKLLVNREDSKKDAIKKLKNSGYKCK